LTGIKEAKYFTVSTNFLIFGKSKLTMHADIPRICSKSITSFCIWLKNDYCDRYGYDKTMKIFNEYGGALSVQDGEFVSD
jgi:hypothetical protein